MKKAAIAKYKHATTKVTRTEWYTDLAVADSVSETSRAIKASNKFIAFSYSTGGGAVGIIGLNENGGKFEKGGVPLLSGHSSPVTDFDFSPFNDHSIATASEDTTIKLWTIPVEGLSSSTSESDLTLRGHDKKIENVLFHPSSEGILASAGGTEIRVWDIKNSETKYNIKSPDTVFSISWKSDGSLLASTSKDKKIRTIDPRSNVVAQEVEGHSGVKASIVLWLGSLDQLLSTGFNKTREREYYLWDSRNLSKPLKMNQLDSSTGVLIPLYDEDTGMLFLAGKGDNTVRWWEMQHDKTPYFQWEGGSSVNNEPHRGFTLVPKFGLNVMKCEVAQVLRITQNSIIPVRFNVPRKTYTLFHDDIFPDAKWTVPGMTSEEWFSGENKEVPRFSLDPAKRSTLTTSTSSSSNATKNTTKNETKNETSIETKVESMTLQPSTSNSTNLSSSSENTQVESRENDKVITMKDMKYKFTGVRSSRFRYIEGKPLHPSNNYDHLKDLSLKMSAECDVLACSSSFLVVPLNKSGGQLGVIPISKVGRQPPKLPSLVNTTDVLDFVFNPFNPNEIAAACDDGYIRIWDIPSGGLSEDLTEFRLKLSGHKHRVNIVRYHPFARDILISSSPELGDPSIKYWDLKTGKEVISLTGFQDQVFSFDHNFDGSLLAVVSKDKMLRIFNPREKKLLREGFSHEGVRGGRVCWLGKTGLICTVGFDKSSQREFKIFHFEDISKPLATHTIDISPGALIPFYDEDTSVLYLWGRGDTSNSFYEIVGEKPYAHFLTKYDSANMIVGEAFLPKTSLDVKSVEVAKSYVLTQTHIETVSFKVPRTRMEYFQDDIFPPTRDLRTPILESNEWLSGTTKEPPVISLQPEGMKPVTEAPIEVKAKKYESRKADELSPDETNKKVLDNMFLNVRNEKGDGTLPQDNKEGVEDSEWD